MKAVPPLKSEVFSRSELRQDNGLSAQKAFEGVRRECVGFMFAHFGEAGFATDLPGEEYGKDAKNYETCAADYANVNAHAPRWRERERRGVYEEAPGFRLGPLGRRGRLGPLGRLGRRGPVLVPPPSARRG